MENSLHILTVFKESKEYSTDVLRWFTSQQFLPKDIKIIRDSPWEKWWSKMILFSPHIKGDILYFDIDTVFVRDNCVDNYKNLNNDYFLTDFYKPETDIGSGVMYLKDNEIRRNVWNDWVSNSKDIIENFRGDQDFLNNYYFNNCSRWQDCFPGEILSYKSDIRDGSGITENCNIICYHGTPRPWDKETAYD